LLSTILQ